MRTLNKVVLMLGLALLACSTALAQQNTLTQTTLSGAMTDSTTSLRVASATNVTAAAGGTTNTLLYIDREALSVTTVNGTTVNVVRGASGTRASSHSSGAIVLVGRPVWFGETEQNGSCTPANVVATPYVNVLSGNQWICSTVLNHWVPGWGNTGDSSTPIGVTAAVASTAGAITPSGPLFHVTGTAAITGFTIPVGYNGGDFCIIPDGIFTTTTAGNIALASTGVVSKRLCYSYDKNASKPFFPSY